MEHRIEKDENQVQREFETELEGICALDPGVRTFMTAHDPRGRVWEWGNQDYGRIHRLCRAVDKLQSRWSQKGVNHKKRHKLQRAARRIRQKIRNLVDEMHKQLAKWLCENFRAILLPKFETSKMVRKGKRKLNSKTARAMLTWGHYRFRQRLLHRVRAYPGRHVIICDEAYTSKTCTRCGKIHHKLGGNKTFKCPEPSCRRECEESTETAGSNGQ